jgi:CRP-like cAMP-binding protein
VDPLRKAIMRLASVGNRLLAALPQADLALLAPHLQTVPLKQDTVVVQSGDSLAQVYFPHSGAIAFMLDMPNGQTVATAMIGCEGAVGALSVFGPTRSPITAVVRVGGSASQISASHLQAAFARSPEIQRMVRTHIKAMMMQLQHISACNALHRVEARTARWLLHIHDHTPGDKIPATQEMLAHLLGVRRTTVTLVMRKLRDAGAIKSEQRGLLEINKSRLEQTSCECYAMMRREIDDIFPREATKRCPHNAPVRAAGRRTA